jgi:hypothetical protein
MGAHQSSLPRLLSFELSTPEVPAGSPTWQRFSASENARFVGVTSDCHFRSSAVLDVELGVYAMRNTEGLEGAGKRRSSVVLWSASLENARTRMKKREQESLS